MNSPEHAQLSDVNCRTDIEDIVARFYGDMLKDPVVGFIFTDIAKIDLEAHLPIIVDFWSDVVFVKKNEQKQYRRNALRKHVELDRLIHLKPGHFTRWLYLFNKAIDQQHSGSNAELMKTRAELVAKSISAAVSGQKKQDMNLVLPNFD